MKKIVLFSILFSFCFSLIGCGSTQNEGEISEEEMPQESSICPEGFYRFDSIKRCMMIENVE